MADTTLPGVLLKGVAGSRPLASSVAKGTIYSATDTGAITQSDGVSTWSTYATISSGLADPMTTRGDIIVRNSSNATARLAIGSSGKVLSSDGTDISWQTPTGGTTPAFVGVRAIRTTAQTISTATVTAIAFNGTDAFDTSAFHDPASNNSRLVVPSGKDGYYLAIANIQWATSTTGTRIAGIKKNGTTMVAEIEYNPNVTVVDGIGCSVSAIVSLVATDYLEVIVYQTTGGNLDTRATASAEGCNFQMTLLGT